MNDLQEYLSPINKAALNDDNEYNDGQYGHVIQANEGYLPNLEDADIVFIGIDEFRGAGFIAQESAADSIRKQFFRLHYWHKDVQIVDLGNVKPGASIHDSYSAAKVVIEEIVRMNKIVVILGGSHDNTMAQYLAYKGLGKIIEATVIDAKIDLKSGNPLPDENFLMEMLTSEPNIVKHFNHIGFQSYMVHPQILEAIDKLRFDCFRVGAAKENIEEMEPVIRNSDLVSFDISAIKNSDAPASIYSPNGFTGEEACNLTRYAGMSSNLSSIGFYNYDVTKDVNDLTAMQIAQMIWYFVDGRSRGKQEVDLTETSYFNRFHTAFAEVDTVFLQSKRTGRWWMQMPNLKLIACSYNDYIQASNNEIPERWLRTQERDV
jgi:arginase family enzyme